MTKKYWVKLYVEILEDQKMGFLSDHLWRFLVELFLLAGKEERDGALPPVEGIAWALRMSKEQVLEDLKSLAETGVVQEVQAGLWYVTNFSKRQAASPIQERVRRFRESNGDVTKRYENSNEAGEDGSASSSESEFISGEGIEEKSFQGDVTNRYKNCNGKAGDSVSASASVSESDSVSEEGDEVQEKGEAEEVPRTPKAAMEQRDIRVFMAATGGRVPGAGQYAPVIDVVRLMRTRKGLDDARLADFLAPYWLAWSTRKRRDGKPYDPGNISWLTEWALNETIPPGGQDASLSLAEQNAAAIREVARRKNGRRV